MKQGNWVVTDNGLGTPTIVYLKKDEGKGLFSAWFYNPNFGLDCADWALFSKEDYPNSRLLTELEIRSLGKKVLESVE
jgi:hypothetical protein